MGGKQTEEDYLHETLAMLQESYAKAAKPYIDRLVAIQAMKPPQPMIVTREQYEMKEAFEKQYLFAVTDDMDIQTEVAWKNWQEWLDACAARFIARAKMLPEDAAHHANVCLEAVDGDLTESPEDAADEEMSNWAD